MDITSPPVTNKISPQKVSPKKVSPGFLRKQEKPVTPDVTSLKGEA